jgi:hypothetical protein
MRHAALFLHLRRWTDEQLFVHFDSPALQKNMQLFPSQRVPVYVTHFALILSHTLSSATLVKDTYNIHHKWSHLALRIGNIEWFVLLSLFTKAKTSHFLLVPKNFVAVSIMWLYFPTFIIHTL